MMWLAQCFLIIWFINLNSREEGVSSRDRIPTPSVLVLPGRNYQPKKQRGLKANKHFLHDYEVGVKQVLSFSSSSVLACGEACDERWRVLCDTFGTIVIAKIPLVLIRATTAQTREHTISWAPRDLNFVKRVVWERSWTKFGGWSGALLGVVGHQRFGNFSVRFYLGSSRMDFVSSTTIVGF